MELLRTGSLAPSQCVLHRGDDLVDRDRPVAVEIAALARNNLFALERVVDKLNQLVDIDTAVAIAIAGTPDPTAGLRRLCHYR